MCTKTAHQKWVKKILENFERENEGQSPEGLIEGRNMELMRETDEVRGRGENTMGII